MTYDIVVGIVIILIFVTNALSFVAGYGQREMELRNAEKNLKR